ncbi:MAG: glycoside hydrolase family 2 protein [Fimbriimonadales bacterium]
MGRIPRILLLALIPPVSQIGLCQVPNNGVLNLGGFNCIDLRPYRNDNYLDLYRTGFWSYASFRMDIWKRMGVPYWYPQGTGNIRVAGPLYRGPVTDVVSAASSGAAAKADAQQPGNGAISFANDGDPFSYWYAGDNHPTGRLWIEFKRPQRVKEVRFLGWAEPRHAPKDYSVGLILPDGSRRELANLHDEKRRGEWISFPIQPTKAAGIYLDVRSTMEAVHGPVIYEFQARGDRQPAAEAYPAQIDVPLKGLTAKEIFVLGNVGGGFDTTPDVRTPVGEYVFVYKNGKQERVPLIAGRNVASTLYGNFIPEAQFAWGLRDRDAILASSSGKLFYHLGELAEVEPKRQLMVYSHRLSHPEWPLARLTFRCTNPRAFLILQGLTLLSSGERMNALFYNGRRLDPTPKSAPSAGPSWRDAQRDPKRTILLDGAWRYAIDPADLGLRHHWFAVETDRRGWKKTVVPSQWYVQGLDYHGVVWFERSFSVPASFPGQISELNFDRVDYDARVWVNGIYVGRHKGAYASFKLDATKAIRNGARNTVVVRVDSPLDPGYEGYKTLAKGNAMNDISMPFAEEGSMGGIYRSVWLGGRGKATAEDIWAQSDLSPDLSRATVHVRMNVRATGPVKVVCRLREPALRAVILSEDQASGAGRSRRTPVVGGALEPGSFGYAARTTRRSAQDDGVRVFSSTRTLAPGPAEFTFDIPKPMLWWPWEQGAQNLHQLEVQVWQDGKLCDRILSRVGIKQVERDPRVNCLVVNHHRIFLKGMLNDDVHWQSLMDRRAYRYRIKLQKDANFNVIRVVTHESSPEFYELCDEMGMLVWQEMPLQWGYSSSAGVRKDILPIVAETVKQTRPHACVLGYSAWNEGGQFGFTDQITKLIAGLDPSRPISRASGGGDWDGHVYPTQTSSLTRRSPLWTGLTYGYLSETGAYGISDLPKLHGMFGPDLFRYGGAEYFWETFASYRHVDGIPYVENPPPIEWPVSKIKAFVFRRVDESERYFWQAIKSMYENTRSQRFAPSTSCIYCRFDDPMPTAFLGIVNFVGQPLRAYYGGQEACQPILPILMLDFESASDVRVVNEYWFKSWKGCWLTYVLKSRDGTIVTRAERVFDLPADSVNTILFRKELGDIWHVPGGFMAELTVRDATGKVLSHNHYDFTAAEVKAFKTSIYPVAPVRPLDSVLAFASEGSFGPGTSFPYEGAYGPNLVRALGGKPSIGFFVKVPENGDYALRVACNSGATLHRYTAYVDGLKAEPEKCFWLNMNEPISRQTYSALRLAWYPGWWAKLSQGEHRIDLRWEEKEPAPEFVVDALAAQRR